MRLSNQLIPKLMKFPFCGLAPARSDARRTCCWPSRPAPDDSPGQVIARSDAVPIQRQHSRQLQLLEQAGTSASAGAASIVPDHPGNLTGEALLASYLTPYPFQSCLKKEMTDDVEQLLQRKQLKKGTDFEFVIEEKSERFVSVQVREASMLDGCPVLTVCHPSEAYEDCLRQLKKDAAMHCEKPPPFPERTIPPLAGDATPEAVLETLLAHTSTGIVIGEVHHHINSKRFLIDNMERMSGLGVETLFLEHLFFDVDKKDLASYLQSPPGSAMPDALKSRLAALDRQQLWATVADETLKARYCLSKVVEAAKQAGLQVVPIDCTASYNVYRSGLGASASDEKIRYQVMNYLADKCITGRDLPGKWLAFVGSGHVNTCMGVPGLAELTGAISLIVSDTREAPGQPLVRTQVKRYAGAIDPDVVLTMPL
jgi:hypothetical protein